MRSLRDASASLREEWQGALAFGSTMGAGYLGDAVERLGVERSRKAAQRASLALLLLDGSVPLDQQDEEAMAVAESAPHRLVVVNKSDLP